MQQVVFVLPFALETSVRFALAAAELPGVRLALISQEPVSRLPEELRARAELYERVEDALDAEQLGAAVRSLAQRWGGRVDRIIGILEQMQEAMAEVRERLGIRGMGLEAARNFRDKARMKQRFRESGLPCARSRLAATAEEALAFAADCLPLVVKPPAGAGAKNTMRVDSLADLQGYLRSVPPRPEEPLLLEEFILGKEHSFDAVSVGGRHVFSSISHYYPTPLEVMERPWIQWCVLLPRDVSGPQYDDIRHAAARALDCLGMVTGLTHMEWFRRPDGSIAISEVAARPPGAQFTSLLSFAHDTDFYRAWARLAIFEEFEVPERPFSVGAVFLRGQGKGRVVAVHGLDEAQRELGHMVVQARIPHTGLQPTETYEGDGFVILRHPETEAVEQGLDRILELIRIELG
jgi:biotin carboxylase